MPSGMLMTFGTYEASGHTGLKSGEIELRGTLGTVFAGIDRFEIVPERGGAFQDPTPSPQAPGRDRHDGYEDLDRAHARNFLDCVKSRQRPNCRRRGRPPLHHVRPPGQHRAGDEGPARLGRRGRAVHEQRPAPTSCSTTSIAQPWSHA